ncbi:hypothetical protein TNCT_511491 [Trichonephila clavata]|uniref:Uncharacterized protein n=1 Tax=Trichonephila clavata TaxID=2740835 RepID=A0A8X6I0X0_TRICU|nr:hypothetical protein TNCT_511491 [Trichonephila clavata]
MNLNIVHNEESTESSICLFLKTATTMKITSLQNEAVHLGAVYSRYYNQGYRTISSDASPSVAQHALSFNVCPPTSESCRLLSDSTSSILRFK